MSKMTCHMMGMVCITRIVILVKRVYNWRETRGATHTFGDMYKSFIAGHRTNVQRDIAHAM